MSTRKYLELDVYGKVPVDNLFQMYYKLNDGSDLLLHQIRTVPSLGGWVYESAYCLANYLESVSFEIKCEEIGGRNNKKTERDDVWLVELGAGVGVVGMVYNYHNNINKNNNNINKKKNNNSDNDFEMGHVNQIGFENNNNNNNNKGDFYSVITELEPLVPLIQYNIDENAALLSNNKNNNIDEGGNNVNNNNNNIYNKTGKDINRDDNENCTPKVTKDNNTDNNNENNNNKSINNKNKYDRNNNKTNNKEGNINNTNNNKLDIINEGLKVYARPLSWGDIEQTDAVLDLMRRKSDRVRKLSHNKYFDIIIIANCIYYESSLEPLLETLLALSDENSIILASYETRTVAIENLIGRWHVLLSQHFVIEEIDSEVVQKETKDPKYFQDYVKIYIIKRIIIK